MEVTLAPISSIPEGEGRTFSVGKARLAVFRSRDGEVFATQADCPHKGGPLADGLLGGSTLICPLHAQKFDLATGQALSGNSCHLKTYPARLSATGQIMVELDATG
jgi:nitrite reductase (NADH) small subunit